jgi:hypothetical protein
LPIVQSSATVKVATNDLTVRNVRANATTGILQVTGPTAATTRVMTVPDANFTAARTDAAQSFTGDQTLSTGNLVVSNGKGIDFSATPGTGTSELLSDYEEGTWTPSLGGLATYTSQLGRYIIIGKQVTVFFDLTVNLLLTGSATTISGLPFTAAGSSYSAMFSPYWSDTATAMISITGIASGTNILITGTNSATTTAGYLPTIFQNGARLAGQMTYFI